MQTIDVSGADTARDTRQRTWSLDARLMTRPAQTCRELATQPLERGMVTALRRPVTIAMALGCLASVASAGIATLRLAVIERHDLRNSSARRPCHRRAPVSRVLGE